jgi:hypothetical protein
MKSRGLRKPARPSGSDAGNLGELETALEQFRGIEDELEEGK